MPNNENIKAITSKKSNTPQALTSLDVRSWRNNNWQSHLPGKGFTLQFLMLFIGMIIRIMNNNPREQNLRSDSNMQ